MLCKEFISDILYKNPNLTLRESIIKLKQNFNLVLFEKLS